MRHPLFVLLCRYFWQLVYLVNVQNVLTLAFDIRDKKKEHLICLHLDSRNALIKKETLSIGLLDKSLIHPREIFSSALENKAANIILIHNHPSGDPTPSKQDKQVAKNIGKAGQIMGVALLDFVIIAKNGHNSFNKGKFWLIFINRLPCLKLIKYPHLKAICYIVKAFAMF
jgi:DNA repair protein RadC